MGTLKLGMEGDQYHVNAPKSMILIKAKEVFIMMEKIKVAVYAFIWAIIAQMAIRAKAEIARTGVYPTPPIPGSFRDKTAKAIHSLCCKAVEVVLTYYHLHKGLGTVFHGVHINGDRRKEVINDFVEFSLGNDYLGFIPKKGLATLMISLNMSSLQ